MLNCRCSRYFSIKFQTDPLSRSGRRSSLPGAKSGTDDREYCASTYYLCGRNYILYAFGRQFQGLSNELSWLTVGALIIFQLNFKLTPCRGQVREGHCLAPNPAQMTGNVVLLHIIFIEGTKFYMHLVDNLKAVSYTHLTLPTILRV